MTRSASLYCELRAGRPPELPECDDIVIVSRPPTSSTSTSESSSIPASVTRTSASFSCRNVRQPVAEAANPAPVEQPLQLSGGRSQRAAAVQLVHDAKRLGADVDDVGEQVRVA